MECQRGQDCLLMMHYVIGDVHGEEEMLLAFVAKLSKSSHFGSEPRQKKIALSLTSLGILPLLLGLR